MSESPYDDRTDSEKYIDCALERISENSNHELADAVEDLIDAKLSHNEEYSTNVLFTKEEWHELCIVMRELTSGREVANNWHKLREKVTRRCNV